MLNAVGNGDESEEEEDESEDEREDEREDDSDVRSEITLEGLGGRGASGDAASPSGIVIFIYCFETAFSVLFRTCDAFVSTHHCCNLCEYYFAFQSSSTGMIWYDMVFGWN